MYAYVLTLGAVEKSWYTKGAVNRKTLGTTAIHVYAWKLTISMKQTFSWEANSRFAPEYVNYRVSEKSGTNGNFNYFSDFYLQIQVKV
jgi:hypothetical protein